jgi:hypothetical protein
MNICGGGGSDSRSSVYLAIGLVASRTMPKKARFLLMVIVCDFVYAYQKRRLAEKPLIHVPRVPAPPVESSGSRIEFVTAVNK